MNKNTMSDKSKFCQYAKSACENMCSGEGLCLDACNSDLMQKCGFTCNEMCKSRFDTSANCEIVKQQACDDHNKYCK